MVGPARFANVIYLLTLTYGLVLSAVVVLVPLYAVHLGYPPVQIGIVIAFQAIIQVGMRIPVGFWCQSVGERRILYSGLLAMAATCLLLVVATEYTVVLVSQLMMGLSRAVFWVAAQSYVARMHASGGGGRIGKALGLTGVGEVIGPALAGFAVASWGFGGAFVATAGATFLSLLLVSVLPELPVRRAGADFGRVAHEIKTIAMQPMAMLGGWFTFLSGMLRAVTTSFFPVMLDMLGFNPRIIGLLTSMRGIAEISGHWVAGGLSDRGRFLAVAGLGFGLPAAGFAVMAFAKPWYLVGPAMGAVGIGQALLHVMGLTVGATTAAVEARGLAVGVNGTFWSVGLLVGPIAFGALLQAVGLPGAVLSAGFLLGGAYLGSLGVVRRRLSLPLGESKQLAP